MSSAAPPASTPVQPPTTPTPSNPPPSSNPGGGGGGGSSAPPPSTPPTSQQPPETPTPSQQPPETPSTSEQPPNTPTTSEQPPTTSQAPPDTTTQQNPQTSSSTSEQWQPTTSETRTQQTSTQVIEEQGGTSYKYVTVTDSRGLAQTSAVAVAPHKNNTPAIVGGVVGGVGGALVIAGLVALFLYRRKKNREVAFDEKMFDPHHSTRHSQADPLDIAPTSPSVGMPGEHTTIEPFPYEPSSAHGYEYDPYQHNQSFGQMQPGDTMQMQGMNMPDARDYMYGGNNYSGYGAAAVGGAAAGALSPVAAAKHREATGALSPQQTGMSSSAGGSRLSHYEDAYSQQQHQYPASPPRSAPSDGRQSVYQHTDMLSEPSDEMQEIPPNYDSIRR
ncbi:unnamed protein product [Cutaneotrichosporon oleaginosum]